MKEKLSAEEFQEFVVDQLGQVAVGLSDVRTAVTSLRMGLADVRVEMQTGFRELRAEIVEIKGIVEPLAKAFDADAEKIIEHDRRIGRLEEHVGIPGRA